MTLFWYYRPEQLKCNNSNKKKLAITSTSSSSSSSSSKNTSSATRSSDLPAPTAGSNLPSMSEKSDLASSNTVVDGVIGVTDPNPHLPQPHHRLHHHQHHSLHHPEGVGHRRHHHERRRILSSTRVLKSSLRLNRRPSEVPNVDVDITKSKVAQFMDSNEVFATKHLDYNSVACIEGWSARYDCAGGGGCY